MQTRCPFPGMDPYIERPETWPDFHNRLITHIAEQLQPLVQPKYVAISQERLYGTETDRPIWPDVSIVTPRQPEIRGAVSSVAVAEVDAPAVFELLVEEIREPFLEIVDSSNDRVVTAIEVLSPPNKLAGLGRDSYLQKREEYWNSGTNLVEIDLLRQGEPTVRVAPEKLEQVRPWHYLVAVTRSWPARQEVYAIPLTKRLPKFRVPLMNPHPDVLPDLQGAFTRCWNAGPYPSRLKYSGSPPGTLTETEVKWSDDLLKSQGFRDPAA